MVRLSGGRKKNLRTESPTVFVWTCHLYHLPSNYIPQGSNSIRELLFIKTKLPRKFVQQTEIRSAAPGKLEYYPDITSEQLLFFTWGDWRETFLKSCPIIQPHPPKLFSSGLLLFPPFVPISQHLFPRDFSVFCLFVLLFFWFFLIFSLSLVEQLQRRELGLVSYQEL